LGDLEGSLRNPFLLSSGPGRVAASATAAVLAVAPVLMAHNATATPGTTNSDAGRSGSTDAARTGRVDSSSALIQIAGDPLSTSPRTRPAPGKKIDFSSITVKSERAMLSAVRNDLKRWLQANASRLQVVGEYDIALNAVAVRLGGTSLATV